MPYAKHHYDAQMSLSFGKVRGRDTPVYWNETHIGDIIGCRDTQWTWTPNESAPPHLANTLVNMHKADLRSEMKRVAVSAHQKCMPAWVRDLHAQLANEAESCL